MAKKARNTAAKKTPSKKKRGRKKATVKKTTSKKTASKKTRSKKAKRTTAASKKTAGKKATRKKAAARGKSSGIDMKPPMAVRRALEKGLDLAPEYGGPGLVPNTLTWAKKLAHGQEITPAKARKMRAYFSRHKVDKRPHWDDPPTPGYVAWLLWGADAGKKWSTQLVARLDSEA